MRDGTDENSPMESSPTRRRSSAPWEETALRGGLRREDHRAGTCYRRAPVPILKGNPGLDPGDSKALPA